jgi:hypothetical protein
MNKHTPGPWIVDNEGPIEGRPGIYAEILDDAGPMGANIVARVCVDHPANEDLRNGGRANARLIAAAPDLLAALKGMLEDLGNPTFDALDKAHAAIHKATAE